MLSVILVVASALIVLLVYGVCRVRRTERLILRMLGKVRYATHQQIVNWTKLDDQRVWLALHQLIRQNKVVSETDPITFAEVFKTK